MKISMDGLKAAQVAKALEGHHDPAVQELATKIQAAINKSHPLRLLDDELAALHYLAMNPTVGQCADLGEYYVEAVRRAIPKLDAMRRLAGQQALTTIREEQEGGEE